MRIINKIRNFELNVHSAYLPYPNFAVSNQNTIAVLATAARLLHGVENPSAVIIEVSKDGV